MKRDTLKDPQPGDRFVLTKSGNVCQCFARTPRMVWLGFGRTDSWTVRLTTLAKIAKPKEQA